MSCELTNKNQEIECCLSSTAIWHGIDEEIMRDILTTSLHDCQPPCDCIREFNKEPPKCIESTFYILKDYGYAEHFKRILRDVLKGI
jgi:hypothetical protein